jgi:hypothetical protein
MADRKSVMVEHLREFAHTQWERGMGKLKARKGLIGALVTRVTELASRMGLVPPEREHPPPPAPAAPKRPLPGDDDEKTPVQLPTRPARVVSFPPKPKTKADPSSLEGPSSPGAPPEASLAPETPAPSPPMAAAAPPAPPEPPASSTREPLAEGFFVARVAGEEEARRHHLAGPPGRPPEAPGALSSDGSLGTLPMDYADDTVLLLPRDPHTLFVFWDFKAITWQRAAQDLDDPRAVLKLYNDKDILLGVTDVALELRGFYIGGLPAGRPYRVEVHFVGRDGHSRRIGPSSNRVLLPAAGPSEDTSVRFLRMPSPAARRTVPRPEAAHVTLRIEPDQARDYITWCRVLLPGSAEHLEPRVPAPGVPPGEQGASPSGEYLHVPRAEGSSEERAGAPWPLASPSGEGPGPRGPETAPPERWVWPHGPGGSSEQGAWSMGSPEEKGGSRGPEGSFAHGLMSQGPAGSSEGVVQWIGSHGPGASRPREGTAQWMWVYGPVGSSEQGPGSALGASGQWVWSSGPVGSSEQWIWSQGPAGASEQPSGPPPVSSGPGW